MSFAVVYGMSTSFTLINNYVHSLVALPFFQFFSFSAQNQMFYSHDLSHTVAGWLVSRLKTLSETSTEKANVKFTSGTGAVQKMELDETLGKNHFFRLHLCTSFSFFSKVF